MEIKETVDERETKRNQRRVEGAEGREGEHQSKTKGTKRKKRTTLWRHQAKGGGGGAVVVQSSRSCRLSFPAFLRAHSLSSPVSTHFISGSSLFCRPLDCLHRFSLERCSFDPPSLKEKKRSPSSKRSVGRWKAEKSRKWHRFFLREKNSCLFPSRSIQDPSALLSRAGVLFSLEKGKEKDERTKDR